MTLNFYSIPLILLCVVLNTAAQLLLKLGMQSIGHFEFSWDNLAPISFKLVKNPYLFAGLFLYIFSFLAWLMTLSRVDVSYAYPFTALGYILTTLGGYYLFQENINLVRVLGIIVIIIGVYLVARSS